MSSIQPDLCLCTIGQSDDRIVGIHMDNGDCSVGVGDGLHHTRNVLAHLPGKITCRYILGTYANLEYV